MKRLFLASFLCLFILFLAFSEDLLTGIDNALREKNKDIHDPQMLGQLPMEAVNAELFARLDRQPVELSNKYNIYAIEDWAFAYADLTTVHIPEGVTVIGKGAFANNALSSVLLPRSLQTISEWAFAHNKISKVVFPENVTMIGDYAFWGNTVAEVILGDFVQLSREAIDNEFYESYNAENKAAGHYVKKDGIWLRE
jgi:hypothetical protein